MEQKSIRVNVKGNPPLINFSELQDFQDDLKYLSPENLEKLCNSLVRKGVSTPFIIWEQDDLPVKNKWIIDGHQRKKALLKLKELGYKIPEKVPYYPLEFKSKKEAKEMAVILAGTYGAVDEEILFGMVKQYGLEIKDIFADQSIADDDIFEKQLTQNSWKDEDENEDEDEDEDKNEMFDTAFIKIAVFKDHEKQINKDLNEILKKEKLENFGEVLTFLIKKYKDENKIQ